jgi:hypothetical protein
VSPAGQRTPTSDPPLARPTDEDYAAASTPPTVRFPLPLERLRRYVELADFKGYDPYDALKSPFLRRLTAGRKYPRIAVIQALKRLPINLRPLLGVPKGHNPKGLGLFLGGYARLHHLGDPGAQIQIERLLDLLERYRSPACSGHAWGYDFDWQSRAFFVPKGTPTIVNTSFIGHALLDAHELAPAPLAERALALALPTREFLLGDLARTPHPDAPQDAFCFSYTPIDRLVVHNANLLGASLLARLAPHLDATDPDAAAEARDAARRSLRYSLRYQRPDGSWWYADTEIQRWIDGFHTGFNLESVQRCLDAGLFADDPAEAATTREAFDRGTRYYADHFFLPDGTAKYFHDRADPEDVHAGAEAVSFFAGQPQPEYRALARRVYDHLIDAFQDPAGYFYFQRRKRFTIRIPYMRWSQSWAFRALTEAVYRDLDGGQAARDEARARRAAYPVEEI